MRLCLCALVAALSHPPSALATSSSVLELALEVSDAEPVPDGHVAISPTGDHVYIAEPNDGIYAYDRDLGTGLLTLVELESIAHTRGIAMSSDGVHVYAVDSVTDAIHIFERDLVTGELTAAGTEPITNPETITLSPDGAHVYVGWSGGIEVYSRDLGTGALTFVESESIALEDSSAHLAFSHDGLFVYPAVESFLHNGVAILARDPVTGALSGFVAPPTSEEVKAVAVSPDDAHVYALDDDGIETYTRDAVTGALTFVERDLLPDAHSRSNVWVSSDGDHVYANDNDEDTIEIFSRDAVTGSLTYVGTYGTQLGGNLVFLALAPDGGHFYDGLNLGVHERDPVTGLLSFVSAVYSIRTAQQGAFSPGDTHAYLGTNDDYLLAAERDAGTGDLTLIQTVFEGVGGVSGIASTRSVDVSGDGAHVYVAAYASSSVAIFSRDAGTGLLTFLGKVEDGVGGVTGIFRADQLQLSTDGAHLYVGGDGTLAAFSRDAGTGALTFVESRAVSLGGLSFAPGGDQLYAAGILSGVGGGVHLFDRDAGTGALTYLSSNDGAGLGYPGVDSATQVVCSADGAHVYAIGNESGEPFVVLAFARDGGTGALTLIQPLLTGDVGFFELGYQSLALSLDGAYLYAADPMTVFRRDPASGLLSFVDQEPDTSTFQTTVLPSADGSLIYDTNGPRAYEHGFSCSATPAVGCKTGDVAKLTLSDSILDHRDKAIFVLSKGEATGEAEFAPGTDNHFAFCLYDESGAPTLIYGALMPADEDCRTSLGASSKPCWGAGPVTKLKDRFSTPDGVRKATLKSGAAGKTKIVLKGVGQNVREPGLPLGLPVRAQLQTVAGDCWEATFATASKNDGSRFKAKAVQ